MGDDHQRASPLLAQPFQEVHHPSGRAFVQIPGWLVREDDPGIVGKGSRHRHALELPAAEASRTVGRAIGEPDLPQQAIGVVSPVPARNPGQGQGYLDVLPCGEHRQEPEVLEDEADPLSAETCQVATTQVRHVLTGDEHAAALHGFQAAQDRQQRALPSPGDAGDGRIAARLQLHVHTTQDGQRSRPVAVLMSQAPHADHGPTLQRRSQLVVKGHT